MSLLATSHSYIITTRLPIRSSLESSIKISTYYRSNTRPSISANVILFSFPTTASIASPRRPVNMSNSTSSKSSNKSPDLMTKPSSKTCNPKTKPVTNSSPVDKPIDVDNLSQEEFNSINAMCYSIARKRQGWSGLELEDIAMELWIKAIDVLRGLKTLNFKLLYTCLNNRSYDLCRAAKRKADSQFATSDFDAYGAILINQSNKIDFYSKLFIGDLLSLFPSDTKEHKYIFLLAHYIGLDDCLEDNLTFSDLFTGKVRKECEIAQLLGYANDTSNGYRSLKHRVREKILTSRHRIVS